jgi:5-methylcytosine-specific restriction enzyme A
MARLTTLKPRVATLASERVTRTPVKRRSGGWLQEERKRLFRENPLCVACERVGLVTAATERDHIIPLADGGSDTAENTQQLCNECHRKKSADEHRRRVGGRCDLDRTHR